MNDLQRTFLSIFGVIIVIMLLSYPWYVAAATVGALFWFIVFLATCQNFYFLIAYRDEWKACAKAIQSDNEALVDEVNGWTTHFYVRKHFMFRSRKDGPKMGYRYSLDSRPRKPDW